MRRRLVLLEDEDAGANAADRELLVALDPDRFDRNLSNPRSRRSLAQKLQQLLDAGPRSLHVDENAPVLRVSHPTHRAEPPRLPQRRLPVPDPLHPTTEDGPHGDSPFDSSSRQRSKLSGQRAHAAVRTVVPPIRRCKKMPTVISAKEMTWSDGDSSTPSTVATPRP